MSGNLMTERSQTLRKNMTKEEKHLWYDFLRTYPVPFRRQFVVGGYIADFYCSSAKLVIELDGEQHYMPEGKEYDQKRTEYMNSQEILVIRFSNLEIHRNFRGVCEAIHKKVKERVRE